MNQVCIAGKVISEVEKSQGSTGIKIAKIKIAVDKVNKEQEVDNDEFEIVVFKDLADIKLNIGQYIAVNGKISANNYVKDDKKYYNCSIIGNNISLLGN